MEYIVNELDPGTLDYEPPKEDDPSRLDKRNDIEQIKQFMN